MDMKQAMGTVTSGGSNPQVSGWYSGGTPTASHIQRSGEPYGGNFLFEDGCVLWHRTQDVGVGAKETGWLYFYKIYVP